MDVIIKAKVINETNLIMKAKILAIELFKDRYDKEGIPYINHLYYVSDSVETDDEKVVGLLHDTVEDTDITFDDLLELGFPTNIINSVKLLTRDKNIPYHNYIDSILESNDIVAIKVKKADMCHNLNRCRLNKLDEEMRDKLIQKYSPEYEKIENYLKERNI